MHRNFAKSLALPLISKAVHISMARSSLIANRCVGQCRLAHNPADSPNFTSIVDNPPQLVKSGKKHGPGLIVLGLAPGEIRPLRG